MHMVEFITPAPTSGHGTSVFVFVGLSLVVLVGGVILGYAAFGPQGAPESETANPQAEESASPLPDSNPFQNDTNPMNNAYENPFSN